MEYRKDIDGLRAIAVLSVLTYHYGFAIPGGFTGVDVFFVISGFLITSRLASEVHTGQFSLLKFYDRRVRRIIPALTVMLFASLIAGYWMLLPGDYRDLSKSAMAASFGFSNFYFLANTGYFDQFAALRPLLHTWSLGVEEQFYLIWPLLLYLIAKGRSKTFIALILGVLVLAGFMLSIWWSVDDLKGAFFLPYPRAWELALGALLVFLPQLPKSVGELFTSVGVVMIATGFVVVSSSKFPGSAALYPCVGAALIIWPRTAPITAAALLGVLSPIGKISYSLYLWHWPVWVFYRIYIHYEEPTAGEAIALLLISIALAWLSYRFVEQPFRRPRWRPSRSVLAGVSASLVVSFIAGLIGLNQGLPSRMAPEAYALRSLDVMWDWPCKTGQAPIALLKDFCVFGADWDTARTKAVLWGDSHADALAPLVETAAKKSGTSVILYRACPVYVDGVHVKREMKDIPNYDKRCGASRDEMMGILRMHPEIKLVILANTWRTAIWDVYEKDNFIAVADPRTTARDRGASDQELGLLKKGLGRAVTELKQMDKRVVIVANIPDTIAPDPVSCALELFRRRCPPHSIAMSLDQYKKLDTPVRDVLASVADTISPGDALCTGRYCTTSLNGEFLYRDQNHIRRNLTQQTRDDLARLTGIDRIFDLKEQSFREENAARPIKP